MTTTHPTAPADLTTLDDAALAALLAAVAHDDAETDRVLAELDRRDADDTDAPAPGGDSPDADDDDPPMTPEEARRQYLREYRLPGESIVKAADRLYGERTIELWERAEEECRGVLLTREAENRGDIDSYSLFHGNAARAMKWASDELLAWWEQNPRQSWAEFMWEWTGYSRYADDAARAANAWNAARARGRKRRSVLDARPEHRPQRAVIRKFGARD